MEDACRYETSFDFKLITRRCISEPTKLYNISCVLIIMMNLKLKMVMTWKREEWCLAKDSDGEYYNEYGEDDDNDEPEGNSCDDKSTEIILNYIIILLLSFIPGFFFFVVKSCLLGYNTIYSVESQLTFPKNMSPPSSVSKKKPSKKPAWSIRIHRMSSRAYFLIG